MAHNNRVEKMKILPSMMFLMMTMMMMMMMVMMMTMMMMMMMIEYGKCGSIDASQAAP